MFVLLMILCIFCVQMMADSTPVLAEAELNVRGTSDIQPYAFHQWRYSSIPVAYQSIKGKFLPYAPTLLSLRLSGF
jgi:hypothetical protein